MCVQCPSTVHPLAISLHFKINTILKRYTHENTKAINTGSVKDGACGEKESYARHPDDPDSSPNFNIN